MEVLVVPASWGGWCWSCPVHGLPTLSWGDHASAAYDALGHLTTFHRPGASTGVGSAP